MDTDSTPDVDEFFRQMETVLMPDVCGISQSDVDRELTKNQREPEDKDHGEDLENYVVNEEREDRKRRKKPNIHEEPPKRKNEPDSTGHFVRVDRDPSSGEYRYSIKDAASREFLKNETIETLRRDNGGALTKVLCSDENWPAFKALFEEAGIERVPQDH